MKPVEWGGKSALEKSFLDIVKNWIDEDGEVYVMYWFVKEGGAKSHFLFKSFEQFLTDLNSPTYAGRFFCVDVYRHPDFPIRGWINNEFMKQAISGIQDGEEWFLLILDNEVGVGKEISANGDNTHKALLGELYENSGKYAVIGNDIHWPISPNDYQGEWISAEMDNREKKSLSKVFSEKG